MVGYFKEKIIKHTWKLFAVGKRSSTKDNEEAEDEHFAKAFWRRLK